jgi:hypothetical protein
MVKNLTFSPTGAIRPSPSAVAKQGRERAMRRQSRSGGTALSEPMAQVIGRLDSAQVEAGKIVAYLSALRATETEKDAKTQKASASAIVAQDEVFIKKQVSDLKEDMDVLSGLRKDASLAMYSTDLTTIEDTWEKISVGNALPDDPTDLNQVRIRLPLYRALRRSIGTFTIPKRIMDFMEECMGAGAPLDFHETFKDELDDPADRIAVLRRLAELHVDFVGGMVDVERGMIYRVAPFGRRVLSVLLLLGAAALGLLGIWFAADAGLLKAPGGESYSFQALWVPYLLTAGGVLTHIIKKAAELSISERSKGGEEEPQVVLDRLHLWIHVREYRFLMTVLTAIGAFILLITSTKVDYVNAFLVGYTVDSLADTVLQRFNTSVSAYSKEVKAALSA